MQEEESLNKISSVFSCSDVVDKVSVKNNLLFLAKDEKQKNKKGESKKNFLVNSSIVLPLFTIIADNCKRSVGNLIH